MDEKKYKEALERAKEQLERAKVFDYKEGQIAHDIRTTTYAIFPELAESEDEKIRKSLINYVYCHGAAGDFTKKEFIAWLEKQGEQYVPSKEMILNVWELGNIWKEITKGICNTEHGTQLDYILKHWTEGEHYTEWLKKKGEQKPVNDTDEDIVEAVKDTSILDMVEPKFKVGDWIVYNRDDYSREIIQVYDIRDGRYYFTDNVHFSWSIKECDEKSHLWTIQDAKDGDVLCTYECGEPKIVFILKGVPKKHCALSYYCYYNIMYPHFDSDSKKGCLAPNDKDVKPATKEQRDLLFQKMKEVGYEWDAEKKELKKIHVIDEGKSEMDYCFTKMMNGEKVSPTWSEEDERICRAIICDIANDKAICKYELSKGICDEQINWLKSLKQRIGG